MSSDTFEPSKHYQESKSQQLLKKKINPHSDESDGQQTSQGSKTSRKSFKKTSPKVTVLEQLNLKPRVLDMYQEDLPRGTATTQNSTGPSVITAVLKDLRDDIVRIPDYKQPGPVALVNGERAIAVIGGDNIYVQNKTKFIPMPREKALPMSRHWTYSTSKSSEEFPLDVAILVQKVFTRISSVCFGLLGGVALLQLILVHHMMGERSLQERTFFLQSYSLFAQIAPLLFYILLAVCLISVLDRVTDEQEPWTYRPSWILVGIYTLTLAANFSCASYDDILTLYHQNKTIFEDQMMAAELISDWQTLNSARCIFALLGWLLFSLQLPDDLLLKHLLNLQQFRQDKLLPSVSVQ